MRRKVSVIVGVSVLGIVAALVVSAVAAQPQMRPGMAGGMLRMACNIEGLWAELAFEAKVSDGKLLQLRGEFQKAWDARKKVGEGITSREDFATGFEEFQKIFTGLLDAVKKQLTEQEFNKLAPWLESQNRIIEMMSEGLRARGVTAPQPEEEQ